MKRLVLAVSITAVAALGLASGASAASWHFVHFHMNAYKDRDHNGVMYNCNIPHSPVPAYSSDPLGECYGFGEHMGEKSDPFNVNVRWHWSDTGGVCDHNTAKPANYVREFVLRTAPYINSPGHGSAICGWIDWQWARLDVTSGTIRHNHHIEPTENRSGQVETKGGPLFVFYSHTWSANEGYVLGLRGWLKW
jgi:hypothetical protein